MLLEKGPWVPEKSLFQTFHVPWLVGEVRSTIQYMVPFVSGTPVVSFAVCRVQQVPKVGRLVNPVMYVNSADDFINPPELGIAQREIQRVKRGKFVLIPASTETHGHGTHTWAVFWQQYLKELLAESER